MFNDALNLFVESADVAELPQEHGKVVIQGVKFHRRRDGNGGWTTVTEKVTNPETGEVRERAMRHNFKLLLDPADVNPAMFRSDKNGQRQVAFARVEGKLDKQTVAATNGLTEIDVIEVTDISYYAKPQ